MPQMNVTPEQVAAAAAAGLELLGDKDLKVSVNIAMSGQLRILHSMLSALASGEVVLANKPPEVPPGPPVVAEEGEAVQE